MASQTSCQHCNTEIAADQDVVHLHGRCGHSLHLVCYSKRRAVGVSSCCCDGESADLGDTLKATLYDPLSAEGETTGPKEVTGQTARTGLLGLIDAFQTLDTLVESKLDASAGAAIRGKEAVHALLARGIDARTLVRDPSNPLIGPLTHNYSLEELKALGFTWNALLEVGLNAKSWNREALAVEDLVRVLGVGPDHVLQGLCAGTATGLPKLGLSALEWQTLCASSQQQEPASKFFERAKLSAESFLEFPFTLDDWRYRLGLERNPVVVFGLSAEQCWQWLDSHAEDTDVASEQFRFLFGAHVPERPVASAEMAAERGARGPPAARARAGVGRAGAAVRPASFGVGGVRRPLRPRVLAGAPHGWQRRFRGQAEKPEEGRVKLKLLHLDGEM